MCRQSCRRIGYPRGVGAIVERLGAELAAVAAARLTARTDQAGLRFALALPLGTQYGSQRFRPGESGALLPSTWRSAHPRRDRGRCPNRLGAIRD